MVDILRSHFHCFPKCETVLVLEVVREYSYKVPLNPIKKFISLSLNLLSVSLGSLHFFVPGPSRNFANTNMTERTCRIHTYFMYFLTQTVPGTCTCNCATSTSTYK